MKAHPPSTSILLINLGGPDSLDSVEPFLFNLFSDRDIMGYNRFIIKPLATILSRKRAPMVRKYYSLIGGKSPILELTLRQAKALKEGLSPYGRYDVFVAMRYWHPGIEDVVKEMMTSPPGKIIVLPLYPHYSITTTGSSLNEFNRIWRRIGDTRIEVSIVREWYDNPFFIDAMCHSIRTGLESCKLDLQSTHIVFSAHGIPLRFIKQGDPYASQIEKSVKIISGRLGPGGNYHLCYQSRVGPLEWLGPSTEEMLRELGENRVKDVMLVPISFVSDHLETLYEMDILYREMAIGYGISNYFRAPALNDSPLFIEALKDIVLKMEGHG